MERLKICIALIFVFSFIIFLIACDGDTVSQNEYDKVLEEIERLKESESSEADNSTEPSATDSTSDILISSPTPKEPDEYSDLSTVYRIYYEIVKMAIEENGVVDYNLLFIEDVFGILETSLVDFENDGIPELIIVNMAEIDFANPWELQITIYDSTGNLVYSENHEHGGNFGWRYRLATGMSGTIYLAYTTLGQGRSDTFYKMNNGELTEALYIQSFDGEFYINKMLIPELTVSYDEYWENREKIHTQIIKDELEELIHFNVDEVVEQYYVYPNGGYFQPGNNPNDFLSELEKLINP